MGVRSLTAASGAVMLGFLACMPHLHGAEPQVYVIEINKLAFGPAPAELHVNGIVEWRNSDIFRHTATADDRSFDIDLLPGAKGQTVLKRPGVIDYTCRFHPGMKGRLVVAP
ncbi:hypothetical protein H2LOC_020620 (plasmid) [Methylocystis heyeri]|uniref:Uncharacterized protein n=1 Tax=Methylocystis heyeri TaxID=391905 RepID=A0A6B8KMD6_9HYPH|nr:hypothetical protein H2LOC_020620 [Methylocystis heyeri]